MPLRKAGSDQSYRIRGTLADLITHARSAIALANQFVHANDQHWHRLASDHGRSQSATIALAAFLPHSSTVTFLKPVGAGGSLAWTGELLAMFSTMQSLLEQRTVLTIVGYAFLSCGTQEDGQGNFRRWTSTQAADC